MKKILLTTLMLGQTFVAGNAGAKTLIYPTQMDLVKEINIKLISARLLVKSNEAIENVSISYSNMDQDIRYTLKGKSLVFTQFKDEDVENNEEKVVTLEVPPRYKLLLSNVYGDIDLCGAPFYDLKVKMIMGRVHLCEASKANITSIEGDVTIDSFVKDLSVVTKTANVTYRASLTESSQGENSFDIASGNLKTSLSEELITKDLKTKTGSIIEKNKDVTFGRKVKIKVRSIHGNIQFSENL